MEEMGRVSTILESNVPQVMQSQMDMQEDVLGVFTEARWSRGLDINAGGWLIKKAENNGKLYEDLHRSVQDTANWDRRLNLSFVMLKQHKDEKGKMCVEALVNGNKVTMCINIYAPNKKDPGFFHKAMKK